MYLLINSNIFGYTGEVSEKTDQRCKRKKQKISQYYDALYTTNQQSDIFKLKILLQNFSQDTELKT